MPIELTHSNLTVIHLQNQIQESILREAHVLTVEDGEDGMLIAKCPELNVITQGKTVKDIQYNVIEAIELMREGLGKKDEFSVDLRRKI